MKKQIIAILYLLTLVVSQAASPKTLPIGSSAPDFKLPGIDGKDYQ